VPLRKNYTLILYLRKTFFRVSAALVGGSRRERCNRVVSITRGFPRPRGSPRAPETPLQWRRGSIPAGGELNFRWPSLALFAAIARGPPRGVEPRDPDVRYVGKQRYPDRAAPLGVAPR
jgi:hypothetical protein